MADGPNLSEVLKNHFTGACLAPNPKGTGPKVLGGEMDSPAAAAAELLGQQVRLQGQYLVGAAWGVQSEPALDFLKQQKLDDCQTPAPKTSKLEFPGP